MASRLGHDFSAVRIHADDAAAESARLLGAVAWTVGRDVVFSGGSYRPDTDTGAQLLLHELTHVKQQHGRGAYAGQPLEIGEAGSAAEQDADAVARSPSARPVTPAPSLLVQRQPQPCAAAGRTLPTLPGGCVVREPQNCVTYEQWLASFENIRTFPGNEQNVVGDVAADAATPAVTAVGHQQSGEDLIDHPTDAWVQQCLPENLRQTAYALPADCADIAVILRHVWLSAHHREDHFTSGSDEWILGDVAGGPQRARAGAAIGHFYSQNVSGLSNPYTDERGQPIRTFAGLQNLLHPGDLLVWEHHRADGSRSGGHTQTIVSITRANGAITRIGVLQGNQPVAGPAPGRRIETDEYTFPPSPDHAYRGLAQVWLWDDGTTTLLAAGPATSVRRPAAQTRDAGRLVRRISDWERPLRGASSRDVLYATFEAALLELRGLIEGGQTGLTPAVTSLANATAERLRALTPGPTGIAPRAQTLQQMTALITALANPTGAVILPSPLQALINPLSVIPPPLVLYFMHLQVTLTNAVNAP
jgi:hypothetical protein